MKLIRATCMDGGIVGPQICAAGGGGGGRPPEAPGNQDVEANGSADRMVISGRLATGHSRKCPISNPCVYTHNSTELDRQHECLKPKQYKRLGESKARNSCRHQNRTIICTLALF